MDIRFAKDVFPEEEGPAIITNFTSLLLAIVVAISAILLSYDIIHFDGAVS